MEDLLSGVAEVDATLAGRPIAELLDLPPTTDPLMLAASGAALDGCAAR